MISASTLSLALTLLPLISSQSIPSSATPLDLQTVDAQYVDEQFAGSNPSTAFGVPLDAQALVTAVYGGSQVVGKGSYGMALTATQVAALPQLYITPSSSSASNFSSSNSFTVTLADASALGHPDTQGNFRHFLANGVHGGSGSGSNNSTFMLDLSSGTTVANYAGPGPAQGEGPHRYAWLVFQQPSSFAAPSNITGIGHWSVSQYQQSSHLGALVGATFFTVEAGTASYSVAPTSSVNPSTLPAATATGGGASGSGASSSGSGPAPSSTGGGSSSSGAAGVRVGGALAIVGMVMAMLA